MFAFTLIGLGQFSGADMAQLNRMVHRIRQLEMSPPLWADETVAWLLCTPSVLLLQFAT